MSSTDVEPWRVQGVDVKVMVGKIFISYRHEDTQDIVGRIRDWLVGFGHVPGKNIFMDVYSVKDGANFLQEVEKAIKQCKTMLVVIGPDWFVEDKTPSSYVHDEVRMAVRYDLQIIPVLVRGASMPKLDELPNDIRELAYRKFRQIHADNFEDGMRRVADAIGVRKTRQVLSVLLGVALLPFLVIVASQVLKGNQGYLLGTTPAATTRTISKAPPYLETAGGEAHTWTDYSSAGGTEGPTVAAHQTIQVACKLTGFKVADGNTWWYRIASSPWNSNYYVSADAFYNNGATSGSLLDTPPVDPNVPNC